MASHCIYLKNSNSFPYPEESCLTQFFRSFLLDLTPLSSSLIFFSPVSLFVCPLTWASPAPSSQPSCWLFLLHETCCHVILALLASSRNSHVNSRECPSPGEAVPDLPANSLSHDLKISFILLLCLTSLILPQPSPPMRKCQLHKSRDLGLSCSLLYPAA